MPGLNRFASLLALAAILGWASPASALAQTRAPLPPEKPSHQTVPEAQGSGSSGEPLSDKLGRQGGVIIPPANIDTGIAKSPPRLGSESTPVIPPPGTPGSKSDANPK
jgi:hypothetical protein